jgi:hypothetical protein
MPKDVSKSELPPSPLTLTIMKHGGREWMIKVSNGIRKGPYHSAAVAMQMAAVDVLSARKRGRRAQIMALDEYGNTHRCYALDRPDDPERCSFCEHSWDANSHPLPPHCSIRDALGGH